MQSLPQPLLRVPAKDELLPIQKRLLEERKALIQGIIDNITLEEANFDNVFAPVLTFDNLASDAESMNMALVYVSPDAEVQAIVEESFKLWSDHQTWLESQDKLAQLRLAAGKQSDDLNLDPESKRLLSRRVEWLHLMGYGSIADETRKAYYATSKQISELCDKYNRNIRLYDGGHVLFSDEELKGLKEDEIEEYEKDQSGKRKVPVKRPHSTRIMKSATSWATRKKFDAVYSARLEENVDLFRQAILLRDENARRMGYKSDADFRLFHRMAKSTEWVEKLLTDLGDKLLPEGRQIFAETEAMKRRLLEDKSEAVDDDGDLTVQPWENSYLGHLVEEERKIDHNAISAYLPFKETTAAILRNISKYLQLRLDPVPKELLEGCIWHESVDVFAVWDDCEEEKGQFVGYFYADMLDRENKYKHNQTTELQGSYLREDGSRPCPAAILTCCFTPEVVDGCKVLAHHNVITTYHELGHALQVLLARTKWVDNHGYRVALEFGEGIGTVMENYAWLKEELQNISCHYVYTGDAYKEAWVKSNQGKALPPRTIPDELIQELIASRKRKRIGMYLRQIGHSSFDMGVHNPKTHEDLQKLDETKLYHELDEKYNFIPATIPSYGQATFSHLMSGYNAGYYSYVCSNVFGEEIFQTNFTADPTSTTAWKRFRRELLQYGGSRDQTELLEEFLGRPPTSGSLLKSIGIE